MVRVPFLLSNHLGFQTGVIIKRTPNWNYNPKGDNWIVALFLEPRVLSIGTFSLWPVHCNIHFVVHITTFSENCLPNPFIGIRIGQ